MGKCGHYMRSREDFDCVQQLGLSVSRYGPPIHRTWRAPGSFDWDFADLTFADLLRRDILPIVDLCHFGVPDWIGNFRNPDFPALFAGYAAVFAQRSLWVQLYTPVNEIFICATFSAAYGCWNEQLHSDDRASVTALKHVVKANVLAMQAILKVHPDATFVQSESLEYSMPTAPTPCAKAEILNARRFLSPCSAWVANPGGARRAAVLSRMLVIARRRHD